MAGFEAGVARVDITPRGVGYWMGGYLPRRRAEAVHRPLTATAVYLQAGGERLVWIITDLLTFKQDYARRVKEKIAQATGVPASRIWLMATHTHSGPDLLGLFGGPPQGYEDVLAGRLVAVVREAMSVRQPAVLRRGQGSVDALAMNRRERGQPLHDDTLAVLQAKTPKGRTLFTLVNASCHPVVLGKPSTWVSPDFPAALREAVEADQGGLALFINRAHGDVNPRRELVWNGEEEAITDCALADQFGLLFAEAVLNIRVDEALPPTLKVDHHTDKVPVTRPGMTLLGNAGFGEMAPVNRLVTEWVRASIGGVSVVGIPGEPMGRLSAAYQKADPAMGFLFALQGGYAGYLLHHNDIRPGGYEEKLFVGSELTGRIENWLREKSAG